MLSLKNLDLDQVQTLAKTLARDLKDKNVVIGLIGNLGSGKTTFTKAFAKALGVTKVASPTFVIMHEHRLPKTKLFHIDLYRLKDLKDLTTIGLDEILATPKRIMLIEWADKFSKIKKSCDLIINFKVKPKNLRDVTIKTI